MIEGKKWPCLECGYHKCTCKYGFKRTERPAVHPQEPVVQSACTEHAQTEQAAGVVKDGKEPSDRKALSVQSAAIVLNQILFWLQSQIDDTLYEASQHQMKGELREFKQVMRGNAAYLLSRRKLEELVSKQAQVEQEAKCDAAD